MRTPYDSWTLTTEWVEGALQANGQFIYFIIFAVVKRQLLRFQSPITGLFPVLSTDQEVSSVRDSVYCAAAVWGLYQAYRYTVFNPTNWII